MKKTIKTQRVAFIYGVAIFIMCYLSGYSWSPRLLKNIEINNTYKVTSVETTHHNNKPRIKYILQWRKPVNGSYTFMKIGQDIFLEKSCPVNNCYVTWNRTYLSDITDYDAILFYCFDLTVTSRVLRLSKRRRSGHQKYVFVCTEAAGYYPVYHEKYNSFFNMTWTYKLDSDVFYGYFVIKNEDGKKIGPKEVMHWANKKEMKPINHKLREKLSNKKKAAAWIVSHCSTLSGRKRIAIKINKELSKYNMTIDTYGACTNKICPRNETCWQMLENNYYFYLSFENSINEDYVTEKLLNPLQHYTVPIVYGGANYTRFMPDGIYLNARTITAEELVKQMVDIINDKEKYYDFFRWHNHYTYHNAEEEPETDFYCNFCKKINDPDFMNQSTVKNDLSRWWNGWTVAGYQNLAEEALSLL